MATDASTSGTAALSLHPPGAGGGAAAGRGAPAATGQAPPPASTSLGAGDGSGVASPDGGPPELLDDDGLPLSAEAAASPFSPPATARHAAFLKLANSATKAALHDRSMRSADFSGLAAEAGVPLFWGDSVIVADLRSGQVLELANQANVEPDPAEKTALQRRAWAVLLAQALPVLQSRLDKDTLLPGRLRKVEEAYAMYNQQLTYHVTERPVPESAALQGLSRLMGYDAALCAAMTALLLLPKHPWRSDERGRAQAFVLATLRLVPRTAGLLTKVGNELRLVDLIERFMTPNLFGSDFCASVLAMWRSPAVASVLRSRGALQGAAVGVAADTAKFDARQQADLAKRGLRRCALPSCSKQEATVLQFRVCGHCQTTRYCCPEHAKQHWKVHKREYEEEDGVEASGGGGAAV